MGVTEAGRWLAVFLLVGCATEPEMPQVGTDQRQALSSEVEVVPLRTAWEAPEGSTGAPRVDFGLRDGSGQVRPLPLDEPVLSAVRWGAGTAVVDVERRLVALDDEGGQVELARGVVGQPAVGPEGRRLAWVVQRAHLAEVSLLEGDQARVVARGLAGAGALRFSPDGGHLLMVGAPPGGVAGLLAVDLEASPPTLTCLTNCELRTGEPWGDRFQPPPRRAAALSFDGDQVSWPEGGSEQRARWRGGER